MKKILYGLAFICVFSISHSAIAGIGFSSPKKQEAESEDTSGTTNQTGRGIINDQTIKEMPMAPSAEAPTSAKVPIPSQERPGIAAEMSVEKPMKPSTASQEELKKQLDDAEKKALEGMNSLNKMHEKAMPPLEKMNKEEDATELK